LFNEGKDKYAIVLDDASLNGAIATEMGPREINNGISVIYRANEVGFFSGVAAALFAIYYDAGKDDHNYVSQ
jgi:basic membrane lipoprotein Med (substrate-binding protein (PBP1-ABC) superfamily)